MKKISFQILFCIFSMAWLFSGSYIESAAMVNDMFDQEQAPSEQEEPNNVDQGQEEPVMEEANPSFLSSLLRLVLALAVVIAIIIFISKFLQKKNKLFKRQQIVENYGGISLGPNKTIQIIKIGNRYFVVGVGDNIELLMEITDGKTIEQLEAESEPNESLDKLKTKLWNMNQEPNSEENTKAFSTLFNKEINSMKDGRRKAFEKWKEREKDHDH
ncbi:flagellar biosynthetic protein FliO [Gracilibacillus alcaliphilus]|uniref:flagellar biosynthetic protein FliO n=1 Tax=Gracilibacillus alcaliphilus TaxID=1401441 RepID=UPI00195EF17B|nr:flagellar protein FliO/FliZ [Gracilibacillus alcaliphilus]